MAKFVLMLYKCDYVGQKRTEYQSKSSTDYQVKQVWFYIVECSHNVHSIIPHSSYLRYMDIAVFFVPTPWTDPPHGISKEGKEEEKKEKRRKFKGRKIIITKIEYPSIFSVIDK